MTYTYTPGVPLAGQTVAATQDPILQNFQFINASLRNEHFFNSTTTTTIEGRHKIVSMPNTSLSPTITTGCNGAYFVSSNNSYFYDGTYNWQLNTLERTLAGTVTLSTSFSTICAIPANKVGFIFLYDSVSSPVRGQGGFFFSTSTKCYGFSYEEKIAPTVSPTYYVILRNDGSSGLNLQAIVSSDDVGTYTYQIFYRPS